MATKVKSRHETSFYFTVEVLKTLPQNVAQSPWLNWAEDALWGTEEQQNIQNQSEVIFVDIPLSTFKMQRAILFGLVFLFNFFVVDVAAKKEYH